LLRRKPAPLHHHVRAIAALERERVRDGHAVLVHDGECVVSSLSGGTSFVRCPLPISLERVAIALLMLAATVVAYTPST